MPLFYRIENCQMRGVYQVDIGLDTTSNDRHPMPSYDSMLNLHNADERFKPVQPWNPKIRFGFYSLEQLKNWFYQNEVLRHIHRHGYHLSVYKVEYVAEGNTQAVIQAKEHTLENMVDMISVSTLIDR